MREKAFAQLCDRYGPFDEDAEAVLRKGFERADANLVSGAHVLLAALSANPVLSARKASHRGRDITREAQEMQELQLQQRGELPNALVRWTGLPSDFSQDEACTFGLAAALGAARSVAGAGPITFFSLYHALQTYDADIVTIKSALNTFAASAAGWPAPPYGAHAGGPNVAAPLYWPTRREATVSRRYSKRHHNQKTDLLTGLAERAEGQIVLARGPFGSPQQRIEHMLADSLIPLQDDDIPEKLNAFHHIFTQSVSTLHAAGIEGNTETERINNAIANLRNSVALAKMWHAILILTRGEDLLSDDPIKRAINEHLLGALLQTGTVPVVIAYEDQNEFTFEKEIDLPFINRRVVSMPAYSFPNTVNFVKDNYAEQWAAKNISVEPDVLDALDVLRQLEPALHAPSTRTGVIKRKVLPYSAADLLQEAVAAVQQEMRSRGYIRARALTAKERIKTLLEDRKQGRMLRSSVAALTELIKEPGGDEPLVPGAMKVQSIWKPCCDALHKLLQQMQQLADQSPVDGTVQQHGIVTRDIVAAQLLAESDYHLRLWQGFEDTIDAIEPRLRAAISRRLKGV